ncbi:hypothetical protein [Actinomadura sp. 9N407]|uniref:hypothetical protein n=1 Tax=Actinomadura sp. 9N407 TaxID=3375154 RepID=UPI0037A5E7A5
MSTDLRPHEVRFGLLAHLCYKLGERQDRTSILVHPQRGEPVLWVPYAGGPRRLGVGAVDHLGRWLYTYGNQWSVAGDVAGTAARIARAVDGR